MSYRTEQPIDTLPSSSIGMTWAAKRVYLCLQSFSISLKSPILWMGLFLSCVREKIRCFQNLPIFSPIEPFWIKIKFFNFFDRRAEKMCIFALLIKNP